MGKHLLWMIVLLILGNGSDSHHLIVSHKHLTHLNHSAIFDLSITHLDASYNSVRQIDRNQFVHHKLLQTLILSGNKRLDVPPNEPLVNADKLIIFECEHCGITAIGVRTLQGVPALKHLVLGHNTISSIADAAFVNNPHLTTVDLQSNRLQTINPSVFNDMLLSLKSINFNNNIQLRFAADQHFNAANLEEISCENCNVVAIVARGTFGLLSNLKRLNLNRNKIVSIEAEAFAGNEKLEAVYLEQNRLERFDADLLTPLKHLKTLCLAGNPLHHDTALEVTMERNQLRAGCSDVTTLAEDDVDEVYFESGGSLIAVGIQDDDIVYVRRKRYLDMLIGCYMFFVIIIELASLAMLIFYLVKYLKSLEMDREQH